MHIFFVPVDKEPCFYSHKKCTKNKRIGCSLMTEKMILLKALILQVFQRTMIYKIKYPPTKHL